MQLLGMTICPALRAIEASIDCSIFVLLLSGIRSSSDCARIQIFPTMIRSKRRSEFLPIVISKQKVQR